MVCMTISLFAGGQRDDSGTNTDSYSNSGGESRIYYDCKLCYKPFSTSQGKYLEPVYIPSCPDHGWYEQKLCDYGCKRTIYRNGRLPTKEEHCNHYDSCRDNSSPTISNVTFIVDGSRVDSCPEYHNSPFDIEVAIKDDYEVNYNLSCNVDGKTSNLYYTEGTKTEKKFCIKLDTLGEGKHTISFYGSDYAYPSSHSSESKTFEFTLDKSAPIVNIPEELNSIWTNKDITVPITIIDDSPLEQLIINETSTDSIIINGDKLSKKPYLHNLSVPDGTCKKFNLSLQAIDKAGNKSKNANVIINIDKSKPDISIINTPKNEWYQNYTFKIEASDDCLNFIYANDSLLGDNRTYTVTGEGVNQITFKATDKAGNSNTITETVNIDSTKPDMDISDIFAYYNIDNNIITSLTVEAKVSDSLSGIQNVSIANTSALLVESKYKKVFSLSGQESELKRGENNKISIIATDNAGNKNEVSIDVFIPSERIITVNENKLQLWNISPNEKVTIRRSFYVGDMVFDPTNFSDYFDCILQQEWEKLIEPFDQSKLTKNVEGFFSFYDNPKDLGPFGHKEIEYTITVEVNNPYPKSEFETDRSCNEKYIVRLKNPLNNIGSMKFRIVSPFDANQYIEFSSDRAPTKEEMESKNIKLGDDGSCLFKFQINDIDAEPYHCELRETDNDGNPSVLLTLKEDDFFEKDCAHNGEKDNNDWYQFDNSIQLFSANNENPKTIIFVWDEGFSSRSEKRFSQKIPLIAKPDDSGGFTLGLSDAYQAGTTIYATVNHTIELWVDTLTDSSLNPDNLDWYFGDNTSAKGAKVSHAYKQAENRTGNTSVYTLNINSGNTLKKSISMHINDTQAGELLGDEEWIGEHFLTGEVIVPNGKSLTLSENKADKTNKTVIQCVESTRDAERAKLSINKGGSLLINTDVPFISRETQNTSSRTSDFMWSGINIAGTINSSGTLSVSGAQRGLTFQSEAKINLKNIKITDCLCGIHIISNLNGIRTNKSPVWGNGEISNNREYGVKIEANATNVKIADFTGMKVSNNGKDFYKDGNVTVINGDE